MKNNKLECEIISSIDNVKPSLLKALDFIKYHFPQLSVEDECDFKLIYTELLINAVIHGNKEDESKKVKFSVEIIGDMVHSIISDEGNGFDYNSIIHSDKTDESLLDENGRGVKLVFHLAEKVEYNPVGNSIKISKKVSIDG